MTIANDRRRVEPALRTARDQHAELIRRTDQALFATNHRPRIDRKCPSGHDSDSRYSVGGTETVGTNSDVFGDIKEKLAAPLSFTMFFASLGFIMQGVVR